MRLVATASLAAVSLLPAGQVAAQSAALDTVEASVVRVVGESSTGSGSAVAPGQVLTNWHVVDGQRMLAVVSAGTGGERPARVVWSSEVLDLAVLAVDGLTLPPVTIGTMPLRTRERVWALGYPGVADRISPAHDVTSTAGVISRLHRASWEPSGGRALEIIQHSADINPGNSGGPLVNDCGVVIGVNTAGFPSAQGTFLASRITEAARELRRLGIDVEVTAEPCEDETVQATAEAARAAETAAGAAAAAGALGDEAAAATAAANRATWLALGLGAVALPALLLALRKPRREVVRVVERMSRRVRALGRAGPPGSAPHAETPGAAAPPRPAPASRAPVLVLAAAGSPAEIVICDAGLGPAAGGFVVGSHAPLVDGVADHPTVSRRHARVTRDGGRFFIEDLNSSNGTCVNGAQLAPFAPRAIAAGDGVQLGAMAELSVRTRP